MPSLIGSLFVSLTADFSGFNRNMAASERRVESAATGMRRNIGLTSQSVSNFQRQMSSPIRPYALIAAGRAFDTAAARANLLRGSIFAVTAAFGGLGAALTSNVISRYLDTFTNLSNQIRVVADGTADLRAQISTVGDVADRARSSLSATATLYSRLAKAQPGEDPAKLLRRVETINKGLQLGGATAQEAASAAIQFSQAIQSNRLGGEELRAVLETPLGGALAKGMGITIAKFRELSLEGKLTADVLMKALDNVANEIDTKFARSVISIDQALTIADTAIAEYAGKLDQTYGITKALSGGIIDLANSLDTLVPIMLTGGAAAGSLFAGRVASGIFERRVKAIKDEVQARRELLSSSREYLAAMQRERSEALQKASAAQRPALEAAPRSDLKTYQRDVAALEKADARHLSLLSRKAQTIQEVANITKQATPAEIRAAEALANQQSKINDLKDKERQIVREVRRADTAVTGAAGLQSQTSAKLRGQTEAQRALNAVQKERISIARQIATEETKLARQQDTLIKETNASFARAANERAAILVRDKKLTAELAKSATERDTLGTRARASRGIAEGAGGAVLKQEADAAAQAVERTTIAVQRAAETFERARRSAGVLSTAFGLLRGAGASLIGFLGGPWGVAFTAAIGAMAYFGARAREEAERVAQAQAIIREELEKSGIFTGSQNAPADIRKALLDNKLIEENDRLTRVVEQLAKNRDELARTVETLLMEASGRFQENLEGGIGPEAFINAMKLVQAFRDGSTTLQDMRKGLIEMGLSAEDIDRLSTGFNKATNDMTLAQHAIDSIKRAIKELDGEIAEVSVKVHVDDQYGIFAPGGGNLPKDFTLDDKNNPLATRGLTGIPPDILKAQADFFKQETLARARSDKNQEIKDRAAELFDLGRAFGLTKDEATALATEEIRLKDAQKESTKSTNEATREYKKFSAQIAELRETARGAFLSDLDRQVLATADNLKNGSALMAQYVNAINNGDLSKAPTELLQIRDALMQIGAADTWRDIIDQYGTGAQLTQRFADKQAELNFLVGTGKITADQAKLAWADFLTQFADYQWIDGVADAFSEFAESAVMDFENIEEAAANLLKSIAKLILQFMVLEPLKNAIRGGLGSMFGGGFSGGGGGFNPTSTFGEIIGALVKPGALAAGSSGMFTMANAATTMTDSVAKATGNSVAEQAWNFFKSKGLSDIQTAGVLGNIKAESAFNPGAIGDAGKAFGLFQHWANRGGGQSLINSGVTGQLNHAWGELTTSEIKALTALKGSTDLRSATGAFAGFERPRGFSWNNPEGAHNFEGRLKGAEEALAKFGGQTSNASSSVDRMSTSATNATEGIGKFGNGLANILNRIGTGPSGAGGIVGGLLKNIFGQALSPIASAAVLGGAGGLYHGGGRAGTASTFKFADFSHAPRYHNGLRANELTAILQQGEHVLTERQGDRMKDTIGGLIKSVGSGGGPGTIQVNVDGANGDDHVISLVRQGVELGLQTYDKNFNRKAVAAVNIGKQRGSFR